MATGDHFAILKFARSRRKPPGVAPAEVVPKAEDGACRIVFDLGRLVGEGKRFRCVYADPPWAYQNTVSRGAAEKHYRTASVDELCQLPVRELADADCHLHLWTTSSFLFNAQRVIAAWGFQYKSSFVWCKPLVGCGNYWRLAH